MSIITPVCVPSGIRPVYSQDELRTLHNNCKKHGYVTMASVLDDCSYLDSHFNDYLNRIAMGRTWSGIDQRVGNITDTAKKTHEEILAILYEKKLRDLPLMLHIDNDYRFFVHWRLEIGR
jgi:hypothetical protein